MFRKFSEPSSYEDLWTFLEEQVITQEVLLKAKRDPSLIEKSSEKTGRAHTHVKKFEIAPYLSYLPEGALIVDL